MGCLHSTYLLVIYISGYPKGTCAGDNIISTAENIIEKLISTLNEMILCSDKFQTIILKKKGKMKDSYFLNINNHNINIEICIKLLGIGIDNKLSCDRHISTICKKVSNQLYTKGRIQKCMGFKEKEVL